MGLLKILFDYETKELKKIDKLVDQIEALDEDMQKLKDVEIKAKTDEFKTRLSNGETLDDILVEAFALAREACYRGIGEKPFKTVQVFEWIYDKHEYNPLNWSNFKSETREEIKNNFSKCFKSA